MSTLINTFGPGSIIITEPADQTLIKDTAMSTFTLTPTGGTAPYTISTYQGTIPTGTTLASAGGGATATITGTPTAAKVAEDLKFIIVDDAGYAIITDAVNFQVADDLAIANGLDSVTTAQATKSTAFSYQLYSTGGRSTFTWTKATGTWPAGLSIDTAGLISGTPTATGSQVLTFTVTDANSETATTANVTINVNDVLALSGSSFTVYDDEQTMEVFTATGGSEPIYFVLDSGDELPEGLFLTQDGSRDCMIHGVSPSGASNETIQINVTDSNGDTDNTGSITLTISSAPPP